MDVDDADDEICAAVVISRKGLPSLGPYEQGVSPLYTQFIGRHSNHIRCIPQGHSSRQFVEVELTEHDSWIQLEIDPALESVVAVHFPHSVYCCETNAGIDSDQLPLAEIRGNLNTLPQLPPLDEGQPLTTLSSHLQLPYQIPGRNKFYNQHCACLQVMDDWEVNTYIHDSLKCSEKLDLTQPKNNNRGHGLYFRWKKPFTPFDEEEPDFIDHIVLIEKVVTNNAKTKNIFLQALQQNMVTSS